MPESHDTTAPNLDAAGWLAVEAERLAVAGRLGESERLLGRLLSLQEQAVACRELDLAETLGMRGEVRFLANDLAGAEADVWFGRNPGGWATPSDVKVTVSGGFDATSAGDLAGIANVLEALASISLPNASTARVWSRRANQIVPMAYWAIEAGSLFGKRVTVCSYSFTASSGFFCS